MNRLINKHRLFHNHFRHLDLLCTRQKKQRRPNLSHPALWYEEYPISLIGVRQSPVNIKLDECILNEQKLQLPPLVINYPEWFSGLRIRNPKDDTYFGWRVDIPYDYGDKAIITGGPLNHRYKLIQFHAHWGKDCHCGSEHHVEGKCYSAELHFVHWNYDLYSSARQASISEDGLAVIGVFLQVTKDPKFKPLDSLQMICDSIPEIIYKGSVKNLKKPMNILELFPEDRSYFTYLGSLTTPPLWETVTWIMFKEPIYCTEQQLEAFRALSYYKKDNIQRGHLDEIYDVNVEENYRPVQPLNGRKIIFVNNQQSKHVQQQN